MPYASNARTHDAAQIAQLAASIKEFGFVNPVLVDREKGIIAGHGRVLAARKLGLDQIPTIELGYLSEAQRKALVIADNRLAEKGGWDREMLALELADLKEMACDLSLTGFSELEFAALTEPAAPKAKRGRKEKKCNCPNCGFEFVPGAAPEADA